MKTKILMAGISALMMVAAACVVSAEDTGATAAKPGSVAGLPKEEAKYTGQKVSLDFQEANIKSVFRLLSEVSGVNIVAGEDIKGNI
ncbi:MAG TPA: hypothetical protein P5244_15060, partial [Syntrophales bacterium]|nr:hypothetical protein [Syntrophales bacterium]